MNNASDYISLSDNYAKKNREQELICLYQAKFYALKNSDQQSLDDVNTKINGLLSEGVSVPGTSIVILSYNTLDFTRQCLESIKNTISLDRCQVIVVDNASEDGSVDYLRGLDWITLVENHENRGFPGGCNDGIAASEPGNDIYLLNSDTILLPNSLFWLKMGLYESEKVGSTGSMSNFSAGGQMIDREWRSTDEIISYGIKANVPMKYPYEYKMFLIGFSLLLKRSVLDEIGLLDERFNPGNSEDLDICFRILKSGRVNLLCHNSFVVHFGHKSFEELQKTGRDFNTLLLKNNKKLEDKLEFNFWPCLNDMKTNAISRMPSIRSSRLRILDIGCGMGSSACIIKTFFPDAEYIGVEEDKKKAAYAKAFGQVICQGPEKIDFSEYLSEKSLDYVIYSDDNNSRKVKETVKKIRPFLKQNGSVINDFHKPVLSISLLCNGKHKKETIKCLESLMTIRNRLDSEIIIVDTGCNDEMHQFICKYADQVVPFKWCDDFAKARNAGLEKCTGEWFMYIDDDEWFENTDELVSFFTSGEYRDYKQAAYIVRNYLDMDGRNYDNFWGGRLTKRMSDTCFVGKIHEYLTPLLGECKMIHSFVHHYGYVYKDKREHMAKARRNIRPLIQMIKEDPNNIHWYSQLVQEYIAVGDASKLSDFCENVLKQMKSLDDPDINRIRADFYHGKLWADNELCEYDQTIKDFNVYRKDRRNNEICMASMYYSAVSAFFQLKDFKNIINYGRKYLDIYDRWKNLENITEALNSKGSLTTQYVFSARNVIQLVGILISSGIESGEADDLNKYFDYVKDLKQDGSQFNLIYGKAIDAFAEFPFEKKFVYYADQMLQYRSICIPATDHAKELEEEDKKKHNGKTNRLIRVLGQTKNGRNYYLDYLRVRYEAEYGDDREKLIDKYQTLILMTNDFFNLDDSIWEIAKEKVIDLKVIFTKIPLKKWCKVVDEYLDKHTDEQTVKVRQMMQDFDDDVDVRFRFYRLKLEETGITHKETELVSDETLNVYSRDCVSFYKDIYSEKQFNEDALSSMLPAQCIFAEKFLKAASMSSATERVNQLEQCIGIYSQFDQIIREYIKRHKEEKKKYVFILYTASQWSALDSLWSAIDRDYDSIPIVLPVPYYTKNPDGTLGEYHFEKDVLPEECHALYFADVDLKKMHPDVIFISAQMDGANPEVAVPAEYYSDVLQKYTRMLVYVPEEIIAKPGMGKKVFGQVKEQLTRQ
jgi:GT2 family glycosyltransferase